MNTYLKFLFLIVIGIVGIGSLLFYGKPLSTQAGVADNVSGFAWSENIGWMSFNCTDQATCAAVDYGVNVNVTTGNFSGYAWSENIGWIKLNPTTAPPASPTYATCIDLPSAGQPCDGVGNYTVSGWARACAAVADKATCEGAADAQAGGWDGWIKMRCEGAECTSSNYGVSVNLATSEVHGWAWGSGVVGWISFNCAEGGPNGENVCAASNYKVIAQINQGPTASISCPGNCTIFDTENLTFTNNSTDPDNNITQSSWDILNSDASPFGSSPELSCPPGPVLCNYTTQSIPPGIYIMKLVVVDGGSFSDAATQSFTIKADARAGFMCSLDNKTWAACEDLSGKASQGEIVYFTDSSDFAEYSTPSQDGAPITSRVWSINGTPFSKGNSKNPSTTLLAGANAITLTVEDSIDRSASKTHTINTQLPFPEWQEISPF